ncbi:hypothetical protein NM688_g3439 [Phlebia brevispora]|uniref:Uncharacterized protein n=1 Tax=Phlebia brevispora TaxID=194682 RepID=A0ACC1T5W4_9APHY|nr:hypothetical protein NM688_g3439 [Phlebia brevispora]
MASPSVKLEPPQSPGYSDETQEFFRLGLSQSKYVKCRDSSHSPGIGPPSSALTEEDVSDCKSDIPSQTYDSEVDEMHVPAACNSSPHGSDDNDDDDSEDTESTESILDSNPLEVIAARRAKRSLPDTQERAGKRVRRTTPAPPVRFKWLRVVVWMQAESPAVFWEPIPLSQRTIRIMDLPVLKLASSRTMLLWSEEHEKWFDFGETDSLAVNEHDVVLLRWAVLKRHCLNHFDKEREPVVPPWQSYHAAHRKIKRKISKAKRQAILRELRNLDVHGDRPYKDMILDHSTEEPDPERTSSMVYMEDTYHDFIEKLREECAREWRESDIDWISAVFIPRLKRELKPLIDRAHASSEEIRCEGLPPKFKRALHGQKRIIALFHQAIELAEQEDINAWRRAEFERALIAFGRQFDQDAFTQVYGF